MKIKNKNKSRLLVGLSVIVLMISFIGLWKTNEKRKINSNGIEVVAEVVYSPENCSQINHRLRHIKLKYKNKIFVKDTDLKLCQLMSGKKKIKMLTNVDKSDLLFIDEYDPGNWMFSVFLMIVAITGVLYGVKSYKMDSNK